MTDRFLQGVVKNSTLMIGHRGAKGHIAENTLESISAALSLGADAIEIDVFRCKSGELVVFHDHTLERLTNGVGLVEEHSYAELSQLLVQKTYRIPLLSEVLSLLQGKVFLNIELKGADTALPLHVLLNCKTHAFHWNPSNLVVSSFLHDELADLRKLDPGIAIGVLTEEDPLLIIDFAKSLDAVSIHPYYRNLITGNAALLKQLGFRIYPWTVNEPNEIKRMLSLGVDGIISDYPELVQLYAMES
ncbi:glycerophosphodiester phosphodiesterase [Robertkochia solimangrovi]|uniref:glycerophosphodiester phosphodiesterase n=1 Tax=Robertkochia solimangrovi TaxID=2213046 RepID=UPI0011807AD3|nr:glycerophosphodiester phosphodiesterase family protein [Robertkochia solimangrovi]TRZ43292.1 glycerophosphodiester phosphodiesterase [Robertkochia solimangrovi]